MNHRLSANPRSALNVVVGSKNPVKIDAVREALRTVAPSLSVQVVGVSANSGVPSQPFGDTETLKGALVRCRSVMEEVSTASAFPVANTPPLPDLVIAIEGGVGWQDRILSESSGGGSKPEVRPHALRRCGCGPVRAWE